MLGSVDEFYVTRACDKETERKRRWWRQRKRKDRMKEKERDRGRRRAEWETLKGVWKRKREREGGRAGRRRKEREVPCMHSCNTLPWNDCTSGNATPINHRRPRFLHGVRGELLITVGLARKSRSHGHVYIDIPCRASRRFDKSLKEVMGKRSRD